MKRIYKNKELLTIPLESGFYAIVNPKHPNYMRLITNEQFVLLEQIEGGETIEEISLKSGEPISVLNSLVILFEKNEILNFTGTFKEITKNRDESISLWIHLTDFCNLDCSYCYINTKDTQKNMSKAVLDRLEYKIDEMVRKNPKIKKVHLKLSGGEVFTKFSIWNDNISMLVKRLRANDIEVSIGILSNLTILNDEIIKFLKKEEIGLAVSLDGLEKYNDKNRMYTNNKGSFRIVKDNLIKLQLAEIDFGVLTVVSNENVEGLEDFTKFLVKHKMTFRFSNVKGVEYDRDKFYKNLVKSYEIIEEEIDSNFSFENGFSFNGKYSLCDLNIRIPAKNTCGAGINGAAIYLDGSVYFCHTHFGTKRSVGNLFEDRDLLEIIKGGKHHIGTLSSECDDCIYKLICAGGCPVYRVNGKSPECELYKKTIPRIYELIAKERLRDVKAQ